MVVDYGHGCAECGRFSLVFLSECGAHVCTQYLTKGIYSGQSDRRYTHGGLLLLRDCKRCRGKWGAVEKRDVCVLAKMDQVRRRIGKSG